MNANFESMDGEITEAMKKEQNLIEIHEKALKKIKEQDAELKQLLEEKKKTESEKSSLTKNLKKICSRELRLVQI